MVDRRVAGCLVLLLGLFGFSAPAWGARWEPLPLWGGMVGVAAAQGNSSIVYAAPPLAGLYRSFDRGVTWQPVVVAGLGRSQIRILGVDPHDPRRLYAFASDGVDPAADLFRSEDAGAHWQRSDTGIPAFETIDDLAFDPETPGRIYAATAAGLFRSQDGGTSWGPTGLGRPSVRTVAVAPGDPQVVLVTVEIENGNLTLRSSDGGETFVEVFAEGLILSFDPAHPGRLYGQALLGLYRSDDTGAHWASLSAAPFGELAITPAGALLIFSAEGTSRSLDGGVTWESSPGLRLPDPFPVAFFATALDVLDDGTLLFGGLRGVWRSRPDGTGWLFSSTGIRARSILGLAVAPDAAANAASTLWVGADLGLFISKDAGASFQSHAGNLGPFAVVTRLAVHPRRPRVVYALGCCVDDVFTGVVKTEDGGRSWRSLDPGLDDEKTVIAVDPVNPDYVYAGSDYDNHGAASCTAVRSTDGGATWRCLGIAAFINFTDLAIDPQDRRVLYGVFGTWLYRSADRGRTWDRVPSPSRHESIRRVVLDPTRQNRLYVTTDSGFLSTGVFRSDDRGRTWTRSVAGLPAAATVHDLLVDPARPDRLWVAVEFFEPGTSNRRGQVFRSDDAGRRWKRASAGLPPEVVEIHFAADPRGADILYAGTDGQGVYKLVVED